MKILKGNDKTTEKIVKEMALIRKKT